MRPPRNPACDRHRNLQMTACFIKSPAGTVAGHVCPVPSCGRHHSHKGYFDLPESVSTRASMVSQSRQASAREAILTAIQARLPVDAKVYG